MRGSRSLTTDSGTPCWRTTVCTKLVASSTAPSLLRDAAKCLYLHRRSTYTWMASWPRFVRGSPVTASCVHAAHGRSGIGSGMSGPGVSCWLGLLRWQEVHGVTDAPTAELSAFRGD